MCRKNSRRPICGLPQYGAPWTPVQSNPNLSFILPPARRSITEQELHLVDAHPGQIFYGLVPSRGLGEKCEAVGLLRLRRPARQKRQINFGDEIVVFSDL